MIVALMASSSIFARKGLASSFQTSGAKYQSATKTDQDGVERHPDDVGSICGVLKRVQQGARFGHASGNWCD
jgi:hypothetical protein